MKNEVTEKEFWDKFHMKHNSRYCYAKKKTTEKIEKKDKKQENYSTEHKISKE
tara:strand:- start:20 stop:178 length:159 start_codon:yes stop_codon:yes gene_type:complete